MNIEAVRTTALALQETTERPHHHFSSFRVKGRIFMTIPPDGEHIHVFVDEPDREAALAMEPGLVERLVWGGKVVGLRVRLAKARPSAVKLLIDRAYRYKASARSRREPRRQATPTGKCASAA